MHRLARILAPVLLALGLIGGGLVLSGPAAFAQGVANPNDAYNICYNAQCINNAGGSTTAGNKQIFWNANSGARNNSWYIQLAGYVNGVNWPFTDGSGLNARYNGDPVYQIKWTPTGNVCLDAIAYNPGPQDGILEINPCQSSGEDYQGFVESGEDYWVSCYASNLQHAVSDAYNYPIWLGGPGTINGYNVFVSSSQAWSKPMPYTIGVAW